MLDPIDYKEPACPLTGGEDFYNPGKHPEKPEENIPIDSIIAKLDESLNREDYDEADRVLTYWLNDARAMHDRRGELSILNEFLGLSRRRADREQGLMAVTESLGLIRDLNLEDQIGAATIKLNAATTLKCFEKPKEALPLYEEVKALFEKKLPADDPLYAGLLNNMGTTLTALSRFDDAESCYREAIRIMLTKKNGQADAAISWCNLAEVYEAEYAGEADAARREKSIADCLDQAWELLNADALEKNGYYAFVARKCATGFRYYGFFLRARELDRRADRIYEGNREKA